MDNDLNPRRSGMRGFSINRLIPNVLTLAALCSGLTAIRFGLHPQASTVAQHGCYVPGTKPPRR